LTGEVSVDALLGSPYLAFGTDEEIAEHLIRSLEETGCPTSSCSRISSTRSSPSLSSAD